MDRNEIQPFGDYRASDADRDKIAGRLAEAVAEGRLTAEEHAERLDRLYEAKTYAELEPLTSDLPVPAGTPKISMVKEIAPAPPPSKLSTTVVAIMGGAARKGRWLVEPATTVICVMGGVDLDFRNAVLSQREVTVNVTCLMGGVGLIVPPGVRVENSVVAIMGGTENGDPEELRPDAPVIRVTGMVLMGGVEVKYKLSKEKRKALRAQKRAERRQG